MYLTRPLETACHQAMLAVGRSDLALYIIAIVNVCALGSVLTAVFVFHSVFLIAVGALGVQIISLICFMSFSARLLKYHLKAIVFKINAFSYLVKMVKGIVKK